MKWCPAALKDAADSPATSRSACRLLSRNASDSAVRWSVTASSVIRVLEEPERRLSEYSRQTSDSRQAR